MASKRGFCLPDVHYRSSERKQDEMSVRYQVVEKSAKQDGQGNLLCELWLKDAAGGYSLLRLGRASFDRLSLGDQVELAFEVIGSQKTDNDSARGEKHV